MPFAGLCYFFGALFVLSGLLFLLGGGIYWVIKRMGDIPQAKTDPGKMPQLRPLPIPTKDRKTFIRILVWIYDVRKWELTVNWEFELASGIRIIIPEGFVFDGASIPRIFWSFLNPIGLLLIQGLIHDYGYRYRQLWMINEKNEVVPFKQGEGKAYWDQLFKEVGLQVNGTKLINPIAYQAVSKFGYFAWRKNRKKKEPVSKPVL